MAVPHAQTVLIIGAGGGLSAALARRCAAEGLHVRLAAREVTKLASLCAQTGAQAYRCDASDAVQVEQLFAQLDRASERADVVIYNPGLRIAAPVIELDPEAVARSLAVNAFGAFLVAQQAVRRMLPQGQGTLLFTGASASLKGYPRSAAFAMGKFALRGLAQSLARELAPQGIHVAHVVIDGVIRTPGRPASGTTPDSMLDPDAIAASYLHLLHQPRSAWSWEIALRPWVERF